MESKNPRKKRSGIWSLVFVTVGMMLVLFLGTYSFFYSPFYYHETKVPTLDFEIVQGLLILAAGGSFGFAIFAVYWPFPKDLAKRKLAMRIAATAITSTIAMFLISIATEYPYHYYYQMPLLYERPMGQPIDYFTYVLMVLVLEAIMFIDMARQRRQKESKKSETKT